MVKTKITYQSGQNILILPDLKLSWSSIIYYKMKRKILAYYSIFIGSSVIAMWTMILLKDSLQEGKTELSFHLSSEFIMALLCLFSGILLLRQKQAGKLLNLTGLGMVVYSVLNAAGYYGERGDYSIMIMFIILLILSIIAIFINLGIKQHLKPN